MILRRFWQAAFFLWAAVVAWQTLAPNPEESETGLALARWIAETLFGSEAFGDKVAHFLAYAALGVLAALGEIRVFERHWPVLVGLAGYGAMLEVLQGMGGVRAPEAADAGANIAGAVCGYFAVSAFFRLMRRRAPA